jgi:hypothetical protein
MTKKIALTGVLVIVVALVLLAFTFAGYRPGSTANTASSAEVSYHAHPGRQVVQLVSPDLPGPGR